VYNTKRLYNHQRRGYAQKHLFVDAKIRTVAARAMQYNPEQSDRKYFSAA